MGRLMLPIQETSIASFVSFTTCTLAFEIAWLYHANDYLVKISPYKMFAANEIFGRALE